MLADLWKVGPPRIAFEEYEIKELQYNERKKKNESWDNGRSSEMLKKLLSKGN